MNGQQITSTTNATHQLHVLRIAKLINTKCNDHPQKIHVHSNVGFYVGLSEVDGPPPGIAIREEMTKIAHS